MHKNNKALLISQEGFVLLDLIGSNLFREHLILLSRIPINH